MEKLQTSTLRPGLLVSFSTTTRGNVSYEKRDLEDTREKNVEHKKWETARTITDLKEWERAKKARGLATTTIRKVCAASAFGYLCPESDSKELAKAIETARAIADKFNEKATVTHLRVNVIVGRIASDDVEAVKAINGEVRDLMADMEKGLKSLDLKAVRDAAYRAKQIGQMLTPEAEGRVTKAVELARDAASKAAKVARDAAKAGEEVAQEIDTRAIRKIAEQRLSFVDLDEAVEVKKPTRARKAQLEMMED